jgi:P-type E1-E2 ATPase
VLFRRPRRRSRHGLDTGIASDALALVVGLTEAEAKRKLAERGAPAQPETSRSYASIVRANVFTVFNLILLAAGIVTLAFGAIQDALFLGILVANSAIGITQEVRAKNALDRLAALVAPSATVVRDGKPRTAKVEELVEGDLVRVGAGDQVVADGHLVDATGLTVDESILTGEAEPVVRDAGDEIRSGSFAAEGNGAYVVEAVGEDSYAARVAGEAREFRHPRSPLERALNQLLLVLVGFMVPLAVILGIALGERDAPFREAVTTSVAAVVTMVPEGLILLASVTYAVAGRRMARRGALAQQLNAIESLASVDVVCLDKTGTLTESTLSVLEAVPAEGVSEDDLKGALGRYAASSPTANLTLEAIGDAFPGEAVAVAEQVPFSSRRRWSGLRLDGQSYVLGAPELFRLGALEDRVRREAGSGRRVVALARAAGPLDGRDAPPDGTTLLGVVVIAERLRPETRRTVEYFRDEGVTLKVISGDRPETVAAIARDAGIPGDDEPLDGRELPADGRELATVAAKASVIGRISPDDKRRVIEALRESGRYVAMVGDGVNDVPALKAARLAIAQGSGTQMARTVSDLVLVHGDFGAVPAMVGEGRKVLRNLQRVTKLFVTKAVFAAVLILSVGLTPVAYPLLPRHLTLAAAITIGIPSFFLALAPSAGPFKVSRFLWDVGRFAVPAGISAGLGVVASYLFALNVLSLPLAEARTIATTVLVIVGLYLIVVLEAVGRTRSAAVTALVAALGVVYILVLATPALRSFFGLDGSLALFPTAVVGSALAVGGLWLTDDRFVPGAARG